MQLHTISGRVNLATSRVFSVVCMKDPTEPEVPHAPRSKNGPGVAVHFCSREMRDHI